MACCTHRCFWVKRKRPSYTLILFIERAVLLHLITFMLTFVFTDLLTFLQISGNSISGDRWNMVSLHAVHSYFKVRFCARFTVSLFSSSRPIWNEFVIVFVGIFAFLNYLTPRTREEIINILITGLKRLEYRGYDSAGMYSLLIPFRLRHFVSIFTAKTDILPRLLLILMPRRL